MTLTPRRLVTYTAVLGALVAFIVQQVVVNGWLSSFDQWAAHQSRDLRASREVFTVTVRLGLRGLVISFFIPLMAWLSWRRKTWAPLGGLILVLLFETGMAGALKLAIGRTFPYDHYYYENVTVGVGEMAFPSGHAVNVIALNGYVAWYVSRTWKSWARKVSWVVVAFVAVEVGVSSWLIQTHWPTDHFAGYAIGGIALMAVIGLFNAMGLNPLATPQRWQEARP